VLAPRATILPLTRENAKEQSETSQPDDTEENRPTALDYPANDAIRGSLEDIVLQAIDSRVPNDLIPTAEKAHRPSRNGKRFKAAASARGRYVRSVTRPKHQTRIAIDATLRASAPYQQLRRVRSELNTICSLSPDSLNKVDGKAPTRRVRIEPNDLRFKEFKHRAGILFIVAVDASGSMAFNRMAQAKGAVVRLLQHAYLHRDKVTLISFRGTTSEVLLAPTRSVELAKRLVDAMPAGGGTPLAAGVMKAIELSRLARLRGTSQTMLVLFTDGRANVGLRPGVAGAHAATIDEELSHLGALVESEEMMAVVVDTKSKFVSNGEGEALARKLGARYVYLPRADAGAAYDAISSIAVGPGQN
jgi:magnesium chelatase subunit D